MRVTITPRSTNWLADEDRWELLVDVTFENTGSELFQLDKVTACVGGRIQNHVFEVQDGGSELDYHGMMKKRAPPGRDGFHRLKPGESVSERVDIGAWYDLPHEGSITVRFDHFNHFSPDAVQLVSDPVEIVLTR